MKLTLFDNRSYDFDFIERQKYIYTFRYEDGIVLQKISAKDIHSTSFPIRTEYATGSWHYAHFDFDTFRAKLIEKITNDIFNLSETLKVLTKNISAVYQAKNELLKTPDERLIFLWTPGGFWDVYLIHYASSNFRLESMRPHTNDIVSRIKCSHISHAHRHSLTTFLNRSDIYCVNNTPMQTIVQKTIQNISYNGADLCYWISAKNILKRCLKEEMETLCLTNPLGAV